MAKMKQLAQLLPVVAVDTDWRQWLVEPPISSGMQCDKYTSFSKRMTAASSFLCALEFRDLPCNKLATFDEVEMWLKKRVLDYAVASILGSSNGGYLYFNARQDLLTWRAVYEGARFENGYLV